MKLQEELVPGITQVKNAFCVPELPVGGAKRAITDVGELGVSRNVAGTPEKLEAFDPEIEQEASANPPSTNNEMFLA